MFYVIGHLVFTAFLVVDYMLYANTVNRVGAQLQLWPGSGFWVAWKFRKDTQP